MNPRSATFSRRQLLRTAVGSAFGAAVGLGLAETFFAEQAAAANQLGVLVIPKIAVRLSVLEGDSPSILDSGVVGHWTGTALPGAPGNCCLLAHRASHGAPFRRIDQLNAGDPITVDNSTYYVTEKLVVRADEGNVLLNWNAAGPASGLTLVSCSLANMLPTSEEFRLLVRALMPYRPSSPATAPWADVSGLPLPIKFAFHQTHRENSETFVVAADGQIYHNYTVTGLWVGWSSLGKPASGVFGDVSWGTNFLGNQELYVRAHDGNVYHLFATPGQGSGWRGWDSMGAPGVGISGDVCEGANYLGNQELYVVGNDGLVYHTYSTPGAGSGWSGWDSLGAPGILDGGVTVTSSPGLDQRLSVSSGGVVYHNTATPGIGSGWSDWKS